MSNKYTSLQIGIHWLVFLLVIVTYCAMELRGFAPRSYRPWINMVHVSCGMTILVLMPHASDANFEVVDMLKTWHITLAKLGYFVIGLHAAAALMHHYVWKDNTLLRMMPRKRS